MSSRTGLWLSSIRSTSPRVPTVEYARSERSSAKSSQAAWNSALSRARSSALRRRQAGSSLKKVNFTNVRPATRRRLVAAALAAGALLCGQTAPAEGSGGSPPVIQRVPGTVEIFVLPPSTSLGDLERVPGLSLGVMSTGIGEVPPEQTYVDISQGNRVADALYDRALPPVSRSYLSVPHWSEIVRRAEAAPADVVPGLLGSPLLDAGVRPEPVPGAGTAALIVVDRGGEIGRVAGGAVGVFSARIGTVRKVARGVPADGLLIVFAQPSP